MSIVSKQDFKVGVLIVPDNIDKWIMIDHDVDFSDSLHLEDDKHNFNTWHSYAACTGSIVMVYGLYGWEKIKECDMIIVAVFGDVNKAIDPILTLKAEGKVVCLAYHEGLQMMQYVTSRKIAFPMEMCDVIKMTECDFLLYSTPAQTGLFWEALCEMENIKVHYVPYAYPVHIRNDYVSLSYRRRGIMISYSKESSTLMKQNMAVIMMAAFLAKKYKTHATILTDDKQINAYKSWFQDEEDNVNRLVVKPAMSYSEFLSELAEHQICLTFDHALCQGQIAYDCALVGVPCIGSSTDAQRMLFPELAFDTTSINKVMSMAESCLRDAKYNNAMADTAHQRMMDMCSFETVKYALYQLYKKYIKEPECE